MARPNVLMIAVDDLNHWVGPLRRNPVAKTPHIDRLARGGLTFTHAYCPAPVCNASRAALLSGRLPSSTGVYDNGINWETRIPEGTTLSAQFLKADYDVRGIGKLFHGNTYKTSEWTEYIKNLPVDDLNGALESGKNGKLPYAKLPPDETGLTDFKSAQYTIEQLRKKHTNPFFLACGFYRPHLPWNVPGRYFDLYPLETIPLPPYKKDDLDDIPPIGRDWALSIGDHKAILEQGGEKVWKQAMQAYLASISFLDVQLGKVLDAYERSPERDNTIVVLWGDHGWHLGEKNHWRKFALWEEATRTPLIWKAPGITKPGTRCEHPVDLMALYPTLCTLTGIPKPSFVEGADLRPLLKNPHASWTLPAVTTFRYKNHAVRAKKWRYIRYVDGNEELYDHTKDPYEWTNLAAKRELAGVKTELSRWLPKVNVPQPPNDLDH